jgi:hypothetical protein
MVVRSVEATWHVVSRWVGQVIVEYSAAYNTSSKSLQSNDPRSVRNYFAAHYSVYELSNVVSRWIGQVVVEYSAADNTSSESHQSNGPRSVRNYLVARSITRQIEL